MPKLSPAPLIAEMDWPAAQQAVIDGKRIRRQEWPDHSVCVFLADGFLKVRKADGALAALLVSDGDMLATDWVIVREN